MKLNPDCIRYVLLTIEPLTTHSNKICIDYSNFYKYCGDYSKEDFFTIYNNVFILSISLESISQNVFSLTI